MRICLISDTHNYLDPKVIRYIQQCDEIWHAGDIGTIAIADQINRIKPLKAVFGNIDGNDVRKVYPENLRFMCEGMDVWITHIGGQPGKYFPEIRRTLDLKAPKLFICGHSHILKVMFDKKYQMLYMNPGAAGNFGFHKVKTIVRFTIENARVKDLEVIEWQRD